MRKLILPVLVTAFLMWRPASALAQEPPAKWRGTDVVIEEVLQRYGARAKEPLINTNQGDLILFVFALGGVSAGFVLGYQGRRVFVEMEDRGKDV